MRLGLDLTLSLAPLMTRDVSGALVVSGLGGCDPLRGKPLHVGVRFYVASALSPEDEVLPPVLRAASVGGDARGAVGPHEPAGVGDPDVTGAEVLAGHRVRLARDQRRESARSER